MIVVLSSCELAPLLTQYEVEIVSIIYTHQDESALYYTVTYQYEKVLGVPGNNAQVTATAHTHQGELVTVKEVFTDQLSTGQAAFRSVEISHAHGQSLDGVLIAVDPIE